MTTKQAEAIPVQEATEAAGMVPEATKGGPMSMLEMSPDDMTEKAAESAQAFRQLRGVVLSQVIGAGCWVDEHGTPLLEGGGARDALHFLGLTQINRKWRHYQDSITKEPWIECTFEVVDSRGRVWCRATGARSADDIVRNERDVKRAAEKNAWRHAGVEILRLHKISWSELAEHGIKPAVTITYQEGGRGGRHGGDGEFKFPYGNGRGQTIQEASDEGLAWYRSNYERDIAASDKQKWREKNEEILGRIIEEQEVRVQGRKGG